ncbi:MAG: glycogen branching enzyme, partial [Planctomycetaceae bacterium]|nr:glycogen branching enzyme [Planctomycetaceae bacterium]
SEMYQILGAHFEVIDGKAGVRFAVWAPNAREVSVLCDHTHWTHGRFWLNGGNDGIWHGFIPGMQPGMAYKFGVVNKWGQFTEKSDPYAYYWEMRPKSASIVYDLERYRWQDESWMQQRQTVNWQEAPVSVYEVHLGSWKRPKDGRLFLNYRELAHQLVSYCQEMGYTHLQLMPVTEHPYDGSWGYQTVGYFAPTSRFGAPDDFRYFVDHCHQNGIGVLVDWVPAHFPKDAHGLARFDGTCLYEHEDPRQGYHPDWGTLVFNYGRNEVRNFLLSSARFWLDKYHIDGLRVDAVASMLYLDYSRKEGEWVPNRNGGRENLEAVQFLKDMNTMAHGAFPGILTIAEESTAWPGVSQPVYNGGLGFNMKWDMGWMNDTLRYFRRDPLFRAHHLGDLSFRMVYAFTEKFVLALSHDEVVHGKKSMLSQMPGDPWQKFANLRLLYAYQYMQPGKKLLFMGGEIGQWHEWQHEGELDWALLGQRFHDGLRRLIGDLNAIYKSESYLATHDFRGDGFRWLQCDDTQNCVFAFVRSGNRPEDQLVCVFNFTPVPRPNYRVGVPTPGYYGEVINTDAGIYGGSNLGNLGGTQSELVPLHGCAQSISIQLPPLSMVAFKPVLPKEAAPKRGK